MVETGFPGSPKKYFLRRGAPAAWHRCADKSDPPHDNEHDRLPRLNLGPGEIELGLQLRKHLLHQIVFPHGDSAGQQKKIAGQSFFNQSAQPLALIGSNRAAAWPLRPPPEPAPPANTNSNSESAPGPESRRSPPPRPRRKHRHARLSEDLHPALADRGCNRNAGVIKPAPTLALVPCPARASAPRGTKFSPRLTLRWTSTE